MKRKVIAMESWGMERGSRRDSRESFTTKAKIQSKKYPPYSSKGREK
jgi:hypothetical protein